MTWVKLDDSMPHHPKVMAAGYQAFALDVAGICYSNRYNTDGFIPTSALPGVLPTLSNPKKWAKALVDAGRWYEVEGGWQIHDIGDYQPSAVGVEKKANAKARAGTKGNHTKWHVDRGIIADDCSWCDAITSQTDRSDLAEPSQVRSHNSRPDPSRTPPVVDPLSSLVNGKGGLQGGLPNDIPPDEWDIACQMAERRKAEGYPVNNIGGFARRIWEQDKDQIRSALARSTPLTESVAELVASIGQSMPEEA